MPIQGAPVDLGVLVAIAGYWAGPLSGLTSLERKKGQRGRRCCTKAGAFSEVWHWSRCRRLETRSELPQGKDLFIF